MMICTAMSYLAMPYLQRTRCMSRVAHPLSIPNPKRKRKSKALIRYRKIGGVTFPIDAKDMIIDDETGTGGCVSSLAPSTGFGTIILGDGFLKSVIAVFDVGASEFRLRSRGHY